eukprot:m51a1_g4693 hypothetical protein (152) ;mRNA; f:199706-200161
MAYDLCTAYVLWGVGACGACGFQRCYIGESCMGALYFLTGGLCGIGALVDLCLLPGAVERANARLRPATVVVNNAAPASSAPVSITMTNVYAAPPQAPQQPVYVQQPVVQPMYVQQPVVQPVYVQQPQPVYAAPVPPQGAMMPPAYGSRPC